MKNPPERLADVDRAIIELRRGSVVTVCEGTRRLPVMTVEGITDEKLTALAGSDEGLPRLLMTGARLHALGLHAPSRSAKVVTRAHGMDAALIASLTDPLFAPAAPAAEGPGPSLNIEEADALEQAGLMLAKLARLLPAVVVSTGATDSIAVTVTAEALADYARQAAEALTLVGEAVVPLKGEVTTKMLAFRPPDGGIEHLAIQVGQIDPAKPVLVRIHSECFTGDLMGSLRCDCGDQLRGAIDAMHAAGSGILLYLAQEGRGIGLVNKLRAYQLQDAGLDTVDANLQLGFESDERSYLPAATMLKRLGIGRVRLMTNNPAKVSAFERYGIEVTERVPHAFPPNPFNTHYLRTKATKSGHLL